MARIADDVIERIKSELSLLRLVESQGYQPKKQGKDHAISCPFHQGDDTPSLIISPKSNLFNCFGCGAAGSVIDWVMKTRGISFRHAVEILQQDHAVLAAPAPEDKPAKLSRKQQLDELFSTDTEAQTLLNQVISYYHETLLQNPEALAYLEKRGLGDQALIKRFQLGYANRTLGYRLPRKKTNTGDQLRGQLEVMGIYRESGHEHFNGSLVVPVFNVAGDVVEVYGRKTGSALTRGTPKHLYLPGPHAGVWNASGLADCEEVIVCEALLDAMTFWCAGFKNVTASYGTGGFTDDHLTLFKILEIKRVLIAYDRDDAGNSAAEKLAKQLHAQGFICYRLHFPKGMDANSYALEVQPASKSLGLVIRSAEWMGEGQAPKRQQAIEIHTDQSNEAQKVKTPPSLAASPLAAKPPPSESTAEPIELPPLPASAVPPSPVDAVVPEISDHEITIKYSDRHYRVRGLQKNTSYDILKVNVLLSCGGTLHVDTFDMYSAKYRQAFARVAAAECGVEDKVIQRDLGQLLLQLENLQDKTIQEALKPKQPSAYTMDETERENALALLHDKKLTERIINDFHTTGLVGEPTNALMGYLAVVSRKLKTPLAIMVQSTSAAGKSALMDAVLKLVPEEDKVHYSAMTGQSLFYLGETNLKHKILGISEEEGVRQAAYALKLLQSEGELSIASTGKDPQTGKLVTEEYRVEGPVMLFLTTTAIDIDEELLNRCVVLTINESREQTAAIQQRQRQARTLEGLLANNQSEQLITQHQNAQRLLKPLAVVNPYAEQLRFADSRTRTRRDHEKYLTLIDSIVLLHQYQRNIKTIEHNGQSVEYVEATLDDIALANQLAHDILGRSLDELPPPTRRLLQHLHTLVNEKIKTESLRQNEVKFTRREVRETAGLSDTQVRTHLDRLVELEYVLAHHGRNGQRFVYELVFDGSVDDNKAQLIGLIDVEQLKQHTQNTTTTGKLAAQNRNLAGSLRAACGLLTASLRLPCTGMKT
ncbi:MAG: toprim domain-containing protein [Spongiibacteraceae bacterium]|nr:toprim domain-containing protein [Spongiibacteraceae bacterium]